MSRSTRSFRLCLAAIPVGSALLLAAALVPYPAGDGVFALVTVLFPLLLVVLAVGRRRSVRPLVWPLGLLALVQGSSLAGMLWLRGRGGEPPWIGGLPLSAALLVYGLGLLPVLIVPATYVLTFQRLVAPLPDPPAEEPSRHGASPTRQI